MPAPVVSGFGFPRPGMEDPDPCKTGMEVKLLITRQNFPIDLPFPRYTIILFGIIIFLVLFIRSTGWKTGAVPGEMIGAPGRQSLKHLT
jgi:hypothetical protein